jgi:hypothetical protein
MGQFPCEANPHPGPLPEGEGTEATVLARRKPRLLLRLPGSFLLRFDARQLDASLFHYVSRGQRLPQRLLRKPAQGFAVTQRDDTDVHDAVPNLPARYPRSMAL